MRHTVRAAVRSCAYCEVHGGDGSRCQVPRGEWPSVSEGGSVAYLRASADHALHALRKAQSEFTRTEQYWIDRLGTATLVASIRALKEENAALRRENGVLRSQLSRKKLDDAQVRSIAVNQLLGELRAFLLPRDKK